MPREMEPESFSITGFWLPRYSGVGARQQARSPGLFIINISFQNASKRFCKQGSRILGKYSVMSEEEV